MKNITLFSYKLPKELEKSISGLIKKLKKECPQFNKKDARRIAAGYAAKNLPEPGEVSLIPFTEEIDAFYMGMSSDICIELRTAMENRLAEKTSTTAHNEVALHEQEIESLGAENEKDKSDLGNLTLPGTKKKAKMFDTLLTLLGCAEACAYMLSFMKFGDNNLAAMIWGLMLGIGQVWSIRLLIIGLRDRLQRSLLLWERMAIALLVMLAITMLGLFRYYSLQGHDSHGHNTNTLAHSPFAVLIFIVITLVLMMVTAGATYLYYPTQEEEKTIEEHDKLEEQIAERNTRIAFLTNRIVEINTEIRIEGQLREHIREIARDLHGKLQAYYREGISVFKLENLTKRKDSKTPDCFRNPIEPLRFPFEGFDFITPEI